jgi:protein pelota
MRLKHFSDSGDEGVVMSVTVHTVEDIWHLYNLIVIGDVVRTHTVRKVIKEVGTGTAAQQRHMVLNLRVDKPLDYDANGILRVSGVNETECEWLKLNAHHTSVIMYDPPQDVKVFKQEWDQLCSDRLREACDVDGKADSAAIIMHNGLAHIALINGAMCTLKAKVEVTIPKKGRTSAGRDGAIGKFFRQLEEALLSNINMEKIKVVLLCSPGHVREEFLSTMLGNAASADAKPELRAAMQHKAKFVMCAVSSGNYSALKEALADPAVLQRMQNTRCAADVQAWQRYQEMMNHDPDRCAYGIEGVFEALSDQCVEMLMLTDDLLRATDPRERHFFTELAHEVTDGGGTVHVMSSAHVTGEQLKAMTGVAALLRAPMPQLEDIEADDKFLSSDMVTRFLAMRRDGGNMMTTTQTFSSDGGKAADDE